ncbi:MAG: glycerate kinase [Caulobacteraceae bacterium]|nr:glycerate kinase [Caulobacteraceae bacterium]
MTIWTDATARDLLRRMFDAAVARAAPGPAVLRHLPDKPRGRCVVVGAGKAAAAMAAALDAAWPDVDLSGVVVTRDGHAVPAGRIEVLEASHPVPDARSEAAARRMLAAVAGLGPDDLVVALISGGGSALLALPAPGVTLADKQAMTRALLASGAAIGEINAIRKHLSAIKGGALAAAAAPAPVVSLVISDVPGDDPAMVASGPTVPSRPDPGVIRAIAARYAASLPPHLAELLQRPAPPMAPPNGRTEAHIIAAPLASLEAAAEVARADGVQPLILGDAIEGESRELGVLLAGIARSVGHNGLPLAAPAVLLSGGETSVTLGAAPPGRGGRNTECLLSLAAALDGAPGIWAIAGDSDGIDGTEDAAGALITPDTLARGRAAGLDARAVLAAHDSYSYFAALGDLVVTGPTLTNVNDIRAVLVTE